MIQKFLLNTQMRPNQVNFLVYGQDNKNNRVGWSAKQKQSYLILRVGIFLKIMFSIANTEEKPE